jgi:XTP/dITP diphosphohydrolase
MSVPEKIILATENRGKAAEMSAIIEALIGSKTTVIALFDLEKPIALPPEVGNSYEEIAIAKAQAVLDATGLPCIADDSGLCVDALDGAPGIRSRRWVLGADDDMSRNLALIDALKDETDIRSAAFVTCAAFASPDNPPVSALGKCRGTILSKPRGKNGFGYDPIFKVQDMNLTMAELTAEQKNAVSHRSRAIKNLISMLGWLTS